MIEETNLAVLNELQFVTKERWGAMTQNKKCFLQDKAANPCEFPYMSQAVAKSWLRSREFGVDPFNRRIDKCLNNKALEIVLHKNKLLLDIAGNLFNSFKTPADSSGYSLYLFDKDGVLLLFNGVCEDAERIMPGKIFIESTVGTCSHVLSMRYKCPIQIIGPEQYSSYYQNMIGSAAPIKNEQGNVIATLVLNQVLPSNPVIDGNLKELCAHTFGLIITMAEAIKVQIELKKNNEYISSVNSDLRFAYDTLEATLDSIDEGIVHVDQTGQIIRMNREGMRILRLTSNRAADNIKDFLSGDSNLLEVIAKGEKNSIEEILCVNHEEQAYIINVYPVLNQDTCQLNGAILKFSHVKKINDMVNSRSGAQARYNFSDIIGKSPAMQKAIDLGSRFACLEENILLSGESGTGKEMFAQAIHNECCPQGPFIAVNCAALPRELIESELFGYEGGSFTGADRSGRPGKIELANEGTLFLDEIGDMPLELQSVLLRVIEDKRVMRIGGRHYKKVNFKIIAATNKDFESMIKAGLFREDLYFRLSVLNIKLPALRERENDIDILSQYFIAQYCRKIGRQVPKVEAAVWKAILSYSWPGNVRQLENSMIYAINVSRDNTITTECLPDAILKGKSNEIDKIMANKSESIAFSMEEWEQTGIQIALMRTNNNIPQAADLLKISKSTLYRKIKEYNIIV